MTMICKFWIGEKFPFSRTARVSRQLDYEWRDITYSKAEAVDTKMFCAVLSGIFTCRAERNGRSVKDSVDPGGSF